LIDFTRAIPVIALVPLVQWHVGFNEYGKIGLIAWAVMFPMYLSVRTADGQRFQNLEVAMRAAGFSGADLFFHYRLRKLAVGGVRGVELGIGIAWLSVVAAELVGTYTKGFWSGGLGYRLTLAYNNADLTTMYFSIALFGVFGISTSWVWHCLIRLAARHSGVLRMHSSKHDG
jgi:sulfonate transport system permease protein